MAIIEINFKMSDKWKTDAKEILKGEVRKAMQRSVKIGTSTVKSYIPKVSGATRDSIQGSLTNITDGYRLTVDSRGRAKKYFHVLDKGRVAGRQKGVYPQERLIAWMKQKGFSTSKSNVFRLSKFIANTSTPGYGITKLANVDFRSKLDLEISKALREFHRRMAE